MREEREKIENEENILAKHFEETQSNISIKKSKKRKLATEEETGQSLNNDDASRDTLSGDEKLKERERILRESKEEGDKKKPVLQSFWLSSLTPDAKNGNEFKDDKPDHPVCLATSDLHPISLKKLINVKFTLEPVNQSENISSNKTNNNEDNKGEDEESSEENGEEVEERRVFSEPGKICPICKRSLNNSINICLIKSCGHVICGHCIKQFVEPDQMCQICDTKCKKKDIIQISSEGTGFAAGGGKVLLEKWNVAFQG